MELCLPRDWGIFPLEIYRTFSPDLSSIESPVVRTAIEGAVIEKICRKFHYLQLTLKSKLTKSLMTARITGVLVDVLRMAVRYNVLTEVLVEAHGSDLMNNVLVEAKKSGLLSQVVKHCNRYTATSLVRGSIECGMLNDVLREAVECGNVEQVLMGSHEGDVMKDVLVEAKKSGLLSQIVEHCDWNTATSLVRGAIECGMLNDVLREAVECGNMETVLMGITVLEEACEGDVMVDVLVQDKVPGLLSLVVKHCDWNAATSLVRGAIKCGMLNDVLRTAVECGNVEEVLKVAHEVEVMNDVLVEAKKSGFLSQIVEHCDWNTATSLMRGAIECGILNDVLRAAVECGNVEEVLKVAHVVEVMNDVLVEAKKSGLLSQVVEHCDRYTATSLVRGATECGMLNDVLRTAVECGNVERVLMGAHEVEVMNDVLVEAKKSGFLSQVVKHCIWFTGTSLVRGAIECGILNDVLRAAVECGNVEEVLKVAHVVEVMNDVLVEAKKSGFLSQVVEHCDRYTATSLVRGATECGMLNDVLRTAVECGNVETVLMGAREGDVMVDILVEAKKSGFLSQVVQQCTWLTATSLVRGAIVCGMLNDVLREAVAFGNVGTVLRERPNVMMQAKKYGIHPENGVYYCGPSFAANKELDNMQAKKYGILSQAVEYYCGHRFAAKEELGNMLSLANASGYLRRMIMGMRRFNISRDTLIQAAKEEDIVQEVLKFVIQLFEVFNVILAYIFLSVTPRSKGKGHCSSEHRKHVIDHVTIRSGDIEANPGPVFYFNDWLKEMFALTVRTVHGFQGKNIRWRELGIPNPNNGLDRTRLYALFREHAQIIREAESLIPSPHTEEFQLLKKYIRTGQKPDSEEELNELEELVKKRNAKVIMQEALMKLQSLSSSAQREVVQCLDTQQLGLLQNNANTNLRPDSGECSSPETDSGLSTSPWSPDGDGDEDISGQSDKTPSSSNTMPPDLCDLPQQHLPDDLANFVLGDQATLPGHLQEVITNPSTSNLSTSEETALIVRQTTRADNSETVVDENQSLSSNGKLEVFGVGMMKLLYKTYPQVMPRMLQTVMELSQQYLNDSTGGSGHMEDSAIESSDGRGNDCCDTQEDLMAILTGSLLEDDQLNDHQSRKRTRNSDLGQNSAKVPKIN